EGWGDDVDGVARVLLDAVQAAGVVGGAAEWGAWVVGDMVGLVGPVREHFHHVGEVAHDRPLAFLWRLGERCAGHPGEALEQGVHAALESGDAVVQIHAGSVAGASLIDLGAGPTLLGGRPPGWRTKSSPRCAPRCWRRSGYHSRSRHARRD